MPRKITYTGCIRKINAAVQKRDLGETIWNLVRLMVRDLEENPDKITNSGLSELIRTISLLKDFEKLKEEKVEKEEEENFLDRLRDIQEKKRAS
tara:strand:+ start:192 stop:473 length:282 start_codon:yes stop_codon:yes gene_type:complete